MARKFLDKDGLTALWAKIVSKINSLGDSLASVAFSGSYNDLTNKPTIPDISTKVSKSGDTMSGSLTLSYSEPVFTSKATSVDASKSNNNVSSTRYPGFTVLDNSSRILTRNEAVISSDGNIKNYLYVRNYNTSGAQVAQKGLSFSMNKSGALTWAIDDVANFRNALGLGYETYNNTSCLSANNMTALQFIKVVKIGAMVTVNYHFSSNPGKSQSDPAWCALKAGLRPNRTVYFTQHAIGTNINDNCKLVAIYSDGTIKMPNISGSSVVTQCMGCFTFCTV